MPNVANLMQRMHVQLSHVTGLRAELTQETTGVFALSNCDVSQQSLSDVLEVHALLAT